MLAQIAVFVRRKRAGRWKRPRTFPIAISILTLGAICFSAALVLRYFGNYAQPLLPSVMAAYRHNCPGRRVHIYPVLQWARTRAPLNAKSLRWRSATEHFSLIVAILESAFLN
jgi:hypothetical protein